MSEPARRRGMYVVSNARVPPPSDATALEPLVGAEAIGAAIGLNRQGCGACYANRNAHQIQHPFANWWAWVCAPIAAHSLHGGHGSLVRQLDNISSV
jgi:hypothetical protein